MKTIFTFFLYGILFLFFTNTLQSQELIYPDKVTTNQLKGIFENAYIDVLESTDIYLKIKDKRNLFVDVYPNTKYLTVSITYAIKEGTSEQAISKLLNKLNKEVVMLKVWHNTTNNSFVISYYVWLDGGLQPKTLVSVVKFFQMGIDLCLSKDEEKVIL